MVAFTSLDTLHQGAAGSPHDVETIVLTFSLVSLGGAASTSQFLPMAWRYLGSGNSADQYEAITAALRPLVEEVTGDYKITLSDGAIPGGGRQWAVKVFPFDPQIAERIRACVAEFGINVEEDSMGPHRGFLLSTAAVRVLPAFEIDGLVNARLWLDGFWQRINGALGTLIDAYEEEDLAPEDAARMALLARAFANRYTPAPQPSAPRIYECLTAMSTYLEQAAEVSQDGIQVSL
jgi:hypothetical protein